VNSLSLADYYRRSKPAYYRIRRVLAPVALGMERTDTGMSIWAVNATLAPVEADLDVRTFTFDGVRIGQEMRTVSLPASRSRELVRYTGGLIPGKDVVVSARLIRDGEVIARAAKWPEPPKSAIYPDPGFQVTFRDEQTLEISVERPARGVCFSMADVPDTTWDDNMLDLVPGDPQLIRRKSGKPGTITVRWYNTPMQPPSVLMAESSRASST
jgi:beta-mannosidase